MSFSQLKITGALFGLYIVAMITFYIFWTIFFYSVFFFTGFALFCKIAINYGQILELTNNLSFSGICLLVLKKTARKLS
jgi:hypothetical protein